MKKDFFREIGLLLLIGLVYFFAGKFGLRLAFVNASATAVWPPTGIALAVFLLFGNRVWPAIFLGAFFTNITTAGSVATSLGIALGNTLEGLIGAFLVNRLANGSSAFYRVRDIFRYTVLAAMLSTAVSADIGVTSLILGGYASWGNFASIWLTWWLGDASGALIVTPFIILWTSKHPMRWDSRKILEAVVLLSMLVLVGAFVFGGGAGSYPVEFMCIPLVVWVAFRFGRRSTMSALVLLSAIAIWGTLHGSGPFVRHSQNESLLLLQLFMDVVSITALVLTVAIAERRQAEERLKGTVNAMVEGFQIIGYDWRYLDINEAASRQGRSKRKDLLGHTMMEIYPGIEKTEMFGYLKRCMEKRIPHQMDNEFKFPDGTSAWFELRIEPIYEGVFILSLDITERKMVEQKTAREKAEDEALLASIGDGIIATDREGRVILINKAFEELMGWGEKEIVGRSTTERLVVQEENGEVIAEKERLLAKAFATGEKVTAVHYLVRKNGTRFPARITANPVLLDNKVVGAVEVFHDITQERAIDSMKTEFVAIVSHELRTPLTAIKGLISMVFNGDYGPVNEGLKNPFSMIATSSERLIRLVNDMLDVSRLESGKIKVDLGEYIVQDLVSEAASALQPLFEEKKIACVIEKSNLSVQADREKVIEIVNNLIGNALKFTEKGSIKITFKEDGDFAIVFVTDTGHGISEDDQQKLFGKFDQIDYKETGRPLGTGLGLYISREFAKKMGGGLWIEKSEVGKGSVFAFSLPLANSKQAKRFKEVLLNYSKEKS